MLQTIKDIVIESYQLKELVPIKWLKPVLLGSGNPEIVHYSKLIL